MGLLVKESRLSLSSSARRGQTGPSFRASFWLRAASGFRTASGLRCTFRARTLRRPGPVLSMELHTSLGRRRVLLRPAYLHLLAFRPPPALLCHPDARSSDHAGLWRAQDSASDPRTARNIPGLARNRRRLELRPRPSAEPTARELTCQSFVRLLSLLDFSC